MLPLSLPAVASAFMLAFLTSFDEFIVVFFLAGTEPTLPLYIWSQLRFPKSLPTVMALGTADPGRLLRHRRDRRNPAPSRASLPPRRAPPPMPIQTEETERGELQWHST